MRLWKRTKKGETPDDLAEFAYVEQPKVKAEVAVADFVGGSAEDSITRFDQPKGGRIAVDAIEIVAVVTAVVENQMHRKKQNNALFSAKTHENS